MSAFDDLKEMLMDELHLEWKYPNYPQHAEIFQSIMAMLNEHWQDSITLHLTQEQTEAIRGYAKRWNETAGDPAALICQVNGRQAHINFHDDGTATLTYLGHPGFIPQP